MAFEFSFFEVKVQHFSHYGTGTSLQFICIREKKRDIILMCAKKNQKKISYETTTLKYEYKHTMYVIP